MKKVAISVGGSILSSKSVFDVEFAKGFARLLKKHRDTRFVVSVGGGRLVRDMIGTMSAVTDNKYTLDRIAIAITQLHAMMLVAVLEADGDLANDVYPGVPQTIEDSKRACSQCRVVVHGGFNFAGVTTDSCATLSAEAIGAKFLVNISNTDGIYDKDPKMHKDAKHVRGMGYDEFVALANSSDTRNPGSNFVFDSLAAKLIKRSNIKTAFISGDLGTLDKVLSGKEFDGTMIE